MQKSKSALFLMELIIVILFFALTSAVCMQVFVKAHQLAGDTQDLNRAILFANNASEVFYEFGDDTQKTEELLAASFDLPGYSYTLEFSKDEAFRYMSLSFMNDSQEEPVYSRVFKHHIQEVSE